MATVVNNPGTGDSGSGMGVMAVVVLVIVALLFFVYGLPALRTGGGMPAPNNNSGGTTNVNLPEDKPDAQINVPDQIDVNVQQPQGQ